MKRPIVVFLIGYIIGIIWGLYCKISIALLYLIILPILLFKKYQILDITKKYLVGTRKVKKKKFKLLSVSRYSRYLKLILKSNVIFLIIISSIISSTIIIYQDKKYEKFYSNSSKNVEAVAIVVGNKEEKDYKYAYKVKVQQIKFDATNFTKCNDTFLYIYTEKNDKYNLEYGDKIYIKGIYEKPEIQRNYKGFDYSKYLKQKKIYGSVSTNSLNVISKNSYNKIFQASNNCFLKIKESIEKSYSGDTKDILIGLTLGDTQDLDEKVKQNFRDSNISHILAISGMHIGFITLGLMAILKKIIGKRLSSIVTCIILFAYMFITGFSPSVVRATIMGVLILSASVCYRKNDIWTSLSLSLLIILIYNPYLIQNIGLQLSFAGTLGIILFNRNVSLILNKIKIIPNFIKKILTVTISAQLAILPIQIANFNTVGIYFLATNLIVSIIIGPIVILAFFQIILLYFSYNRKVFLINNFLAIAIQKILEPMLKILIYISQITVNFPFSKIYIATPNMLFIIFYYVLLIISNHIFKIYNIKNKSATQIRIKNLINLFKYKINQNRKKVVATTLIICVIFTTFKIVPKNLRIYFIDVGQGDSCLIETPFNKKILVDGGGNIFDKYTVGEDTLLPYLLDRGVTEIDYIVISHFDSDHIRWNFIFATRD